MLESCDKGIALIITVHGVEVDLVDIRARVVGVAHHAKMLPDYFLAKPHVQNCKIGMDCSKTVEIAGMLVFIWNASVKELICYDQLSLRPDVFSLFSYESKICAVIRTAGIFL